MTVARPRTAGPLGRGPRANNPRRGVRRRLSGAGLLSPADAGATSWYDAHDGSGLQEIPSRVGVGVATLGSTTGVDTNDPTWNAGSGVPYWSWDATDDYMLLDASDTPTFTGATGSYSLLIFCQVSYGGVRMLWSSESASTNGSTCFLQAGPVVASRVGTVTVNAPTNFTNGAKFVHGMVQSAGTLKSYHRTGGLSAGSSTAAASTTHLQPKVGIRAYDNTLSFGGSGRIYAVVTWNSTAVTLATLNAVTDYLLASFT